MAYADYTFYQTEYGGTELTEEQFNANITKACATVDEFTHGRIQRNTTLIDDDVKKAACALCEMVTADKDNESSVNIASENVDGLSVSYRNDSERRAAYHERVNAVISPYLPIWHGLRSRWMI